jgi:hypothetical protein
MRALTAAEWAQLMDATKEEPRDNLLFHVAASGPLHARDVVTIELGDVLGLDEKTIMDHCMVVTEDARRAGRTEKEFYLSPAAREVAAVLIGELRERCLHSSKGTQLGDYYDTEGVLRCHACDLPSDWRFWPLFQTSSGRRMHYSTARKRFEHWRSRLGWSEELTFDCLRAVHEEQERARLAALRMRRVRAGTAEKS